MNNDPAVEIELGGAVAAGRVALVSAEDADLGERAWYAVGGKQHSTSGLEYVYAGSSRLGERLMHRVILARMAGRSLRRSEFCDHISGDGLDNRRSNLRIATNSQNQANRAAQGSRDGSPCSSRYKGVSFDRERGKWRAAVGTKGRYFRGRFDTEEEAALAYNRAAVERWGEFAQLNEVGE